MKRMKFRALLTIDPAVLGAQGTDLFDQSRTMVVRARHHDTHCGKVFSALVAADEDAPPCASDKHKIITLQLVDEEAVESLEPGDHFDLWLGGTVGHGVISRQVIPCW
jgi:hypothetical protein